MLFKQRMQEKDNEPCSVLKLLKKRQNFALFNRNVQPRIPALRLCPCTRMCLRVCVRAHTEGWLPKAVAGWSQDMTGRPGSKPRRIQYLGLRHVPGP